MRSAEIVIDDERGLGGVGRTRRIGRRQVGGGDRRRGRRQVGGDRCAGCRRGDLARGRDIDLLQAAQRVRRRRRAALNVAAHQVVAGAVDEISGRVRHEGAVAREVHGAARVGDDEKSRALNGEIGGRRGRDDVSLKRVERAHAGHDPAARRGAGDRVDDGREIRFLVLVAGRTGVRDVLRDGREPVGIGQHARNAGVQNGHGDSSTSRPI